MIRGKLKALNKFDILYTADFNPNSKDLILFRDNVDKEHLPTYLMGLCKYFYEQESGGDLLPGSSYIEEKIQEKIPVIEKYIYQCRHCLTIYDDETGDPEIGVPAETAFEALPDSYCCPLCEAPRNEFERKEKKLLGLQVI